MLLGKSTLFVGSLWRGSMSFAPQRYLVEALFRVAVEEVHEEEKKQEGSDKPVYRSLFRR